MNQTPRRVRAIFDIKIRYLMAAAALFLIETAIALWVRDSFIRPYVGDFLVPILMVCAFRGIFAGSSTRWAIVSLGICFVVETLQAFQFVERIGLSDCPIALVVIGTSFSVNDLLAYTLGALVVWGGDFLLSRKTNLS